MSASVADGEPGVDTTCQEADDMGENLDQAKGRIKQAAGDLTDNKDLKNEGKADEVGGKAKGVVNDVKEKAGDAVDAVKDKLDGDKR